MTLTVEDGSIVANANSYVTLAEARAYAVARGESLPTVDATLESLLIQAMDYIEGKRDRYQGYKVDYETQELQWPRYNVYIDGNLFDYESIPRELKRAQMQLAVDANNGIDLQPSTSAKFATKEKVGPIETEYSEKFSTSIQPELTIVNELLKPLFSTFGTMSLRSARI